MNFNEVFKAIHIAMMLSPDVEKLLTDLSIIIHKYVGPDIDKLKDDLHAVLQDQQLQVK